MRSETAAPWRSQATIVAFAYPLSTLWCQAACRMKVKPGGEDSSTQVGAPRDVSAWNIWWRCERPYMLLADNIEAGA